MEKKIILRSEEIKARACLLINSIPPEEKYLHEVIIRPYKKNRKLWQNRRYWGVLTIIGNELGNSKEELHLQFKERFLVPIFIRDDEDYASMVIAVKSVRSSGMAKEADAMKKTIIALTSTTDASVKQMYEYLDDIYREAANLGIRLPANEKE